MTEPAVKRELRERFLALRRAIAPAERREKDAAICRNIRALECYRRSECVAIYATDGEEPDLFGLWGEKRFFLPRYRADLKRYELVEVADRERELVAGKYGLLEPRPELAAAAPEFAACELLFLTPAVACTKAGVRLGRGGGFYDRMLAGAVRPVIGVIYRCQLAEALPVEAHDRPVEVVVTEEEVVETTAVSSMN